MKLCALVKIKPHPDPDGPGAQYGDVVTIERADRKFSDKELKYFLPVPVDLNPPCGDNYMKVDGGKYVPEWDCANCKDNDPALCDVQKFIRGEWSDGDVLNPPELIRKRRYKISLDSVVEKSVLDTAKVSEKQETNRLTIETWVSDTSMEKTVIEDKATLKEIEASK